MRKRRVRKRYVILGALAGYVVALTVDKVTRQRREQPLPELDRRKYVIPTPEPLLPVHDRQVYDHRFYAAPEARPRRPA